MSIIPIIPIILSLWCLNIFAVLLLFCSLDQPPSPERQQLQDASEMTPPISTFLQTVPAGRQAAHKGCSSPCDYSQFPTVLRQGAQGNVARVIREFNGSYLQEEGFPDWTGFGAKFSANLQYWRTWSQIGTEAKGSQHFPVMLHTSLSTHLRKSSCPGQWPPVGSCR